MKKNNEKGSVILVVCLICLLILAMVMAMAMSVENKKQKQDRDLSTIIQKNQQNSQEMEQLYNEAVEK